MGRTQIYLSVDRGEYAEIQKPPEQVEEVDCSGEAKNLAATVTKSTIFNLADYVSVDTAMHVPATVQ